MQPRQDRTTAERSPGKERRHGQLDGATGRIQVGGHQTQRLAKRNGCQREIRTSQPENDDSDHSRKQGRDERSQKSRDPYRNVKFGEQRQPISTDTEESHVSQRKLSGVAAHQVPCQSEGREQSDTKQDLQLVVVFYQPRYTRQYDD